MYEQDEEYMDEGEDGDEISNEIWQEVGLCVFIQQVFFIFVSQACWIVISSYFEEKGLVRQQLDSFDEFIQMNVQVKLSNNGMSRPLFSPDLHIINQCAEDCGGRATDRPTRRSPASGGLNLNFSIG